MDHTRGDQRDGVQDVLVHEAIYDLMLRAVGDVHVFQQTQAAAAAKANQTSDR